MWPWASYVVIVFRLSLLVEKIGKVRVRVKAKVRVSLLSVHYLVGVILIYSCTIKQGNRSIMT